MKENIGEIKTQKWIVKYHKRFEKNRFKKNGLTKKQIYEEVGVAIINGKKKKAEY